PSAPILPTPSSTLFPYTTLFRSNSDRSAETGADVDGWETAGGATRVAGSRAESSEVGSSRAADATSKWPRAFGSGAELQRYATADRKSTRLNSSHRTISYAVFCL